jgi:hypothetical protein
MDASNRLFRALVVVGASLTGATTGCGSDANASRNTTADDGASGASSDSPYPIIYAPVCITGCGVNSADGSGMQGANGSEGGQKNDASRPADSATIATGDASAEDAPYPIISPCAMPQLHPASCLPPDAGRGDAHSPSDAAQDQVAYPTIAYPPTADYDAYPTIIGYGPPLVDGRVL